jgi:hypothetical protein
LRRVEPTGVSVFVALKHARDVALTVFDGGTVVAQGTGATLAFGKYLHIIVVTAVPTSGSLVPGTVYTYDITFTAGSGTDLLDTDRAVKTLASPNLAGPGSLLEGTLALGYAPNARPGFALPPAELKDLRIAHASCRKPHGEGTDALPILATIIRQSRTSPTERPHQLFLTGDQIYADDVAEPLLEQLMGLAKNLMWGTDEVVLPRESGGTPPTAAETAPGVRDLAVKPPLTSGEAACHLIRLGEFAGMYLFAWSDALRDYLTPGPLPSLLEAKVRRPRWVLQQEVVPQRCRCQGRCDSRALGRSLQQTQSPPRVRCRFPSPSARGVRVLARSYRCPMTRAPAMAREAR